MIFLAEKLLSGQNIVVLRVQELYAKAKYQLFCCLGRYECRNVADEERKSNSVQRSQHVGELVPAMDGLVFLLVYGE